MSATRSPSARTSLPPIISIQSGEGAVHIEVNLIVCRLGTGEEVMRLAEVRLQEGESLENALRRFKRKVQTGGHHQGRQASLLLPEAGREAPGEGSLSAKACSKKSRK